jgi:hypothetical protein
MFNLSREFEVTVPTVPKKNWQQWSGINVNLKIIPNGENIKNVFCTH